MVSKEKSSDPQALSEYFSDHEIDCLKIVPSHLRALKGNGNKVMPNSVLVIEAREQQRNGSRSGGKSQGAG